MYKLLIVEDEKWEREGLRDFLQWDSMGIEVVGCACNGAEGKKMAAEYRPHIIITDIKMPILDGIEMARDIRSILPETEIIILSGYDDFEYAKQTFDFHAFAYLLKPIQKRTFQETVLNVLEKLKEKKVHQRERISLESQWMDFTQEDFDDLLVDFLKNKTDIQYIYELPMMKRIKTYQRRMVAIFSLSLNRPKSSSKDTLKDETKKGVLVALNTMLGDRGIAVLCNEYLDEVILCLDAYSTKKELQKNLQRIMVRLIQELGVYSIVGIGERIDDLESMPLSYAQARRALDFRFLANYGELLFYSNIKNSNQMNRELAERSVEKVDLISKKIVDHIKQGDMDQALDRVDDFLAILRENLSESKILLNHFMMNVVNCLNLVWDHNADEDIYEALYGKNKERVDYSMMHSLLDTKKYLEDFLTGISVKIEKNCGEDRIARLVLKIIEEKYWEDLSLKSISEEVHLYPYYIGRIFREHTGKSFNQFLNDYRINKAKELIHSNNMKVSDLAKNVGIANTSYFCSLFKKTMGLSPGEYMEVMNRRHKGV